LSKLKTRKEEELIKRHCSKVMKEVENDGELQEELNQNLILNKNYY
jgi:hypothetical protein